MSKRRVVVTGIGLVSPLGCDTESVWQSVLNGESGIRPIEHIDATDLRAKICGAIPDFSYEPYLEMKEARKFDPFIQYGVVAAYKAVEAAGLDNEYGERRRMGVAIGSGIGGLSLIEENEKTVAKSGPRRISPFFIPATIINMVAGITSMKLNMRGPNYSVVTACTTGAHNLGFAARMIANGEADVMLAGGAEKASTMLGVGGFASARALSTRNDDPQAASRPFDQDRDGFVLSDGAAVLVLEEYEHAKARGAPMLAEWIGLGMSGDAYHLTLTHPDGRGGAEAMQNSLEDAGLNPEDIDYINAHGTSTPAGDLSETAAIKSTFGDHAYKLSVSSTKSELGHMLGAAGAIESAMCVLALRDQVCPPTINLHNPSPECDLDYVPLVAKKREIRYAMNNSFGFGGTNASLIFKTIDA